MVFNRLVLEQLQVASKIERKVQRFPLHLLPPHRHSLPCFPPPPPAVHFFTIDEPPWTHRYHSKPTFYINVHSCGCAFFGLDICIITCVHHYSTIRSSFTVLKILCAPPMRASVPFNPCQPLTFLLSPSLCLFQGGVLLEP